MDNKKNILFIIPSCSPNGTNSSLSSIYNILKFEYNILILPINRIGNGTYNFIKSTIHSRLLELYSGNFSNFSLRYKFLAIAIKIAKRIALLLNQNIDSIVYKKVAKNIESKYEFDYVVGFQESIATRIASYFDNQNKIAWIHCDYNRAVPKEVNEEELYNEFIKIICVSNYTKKVFVDRYPSLNLKTDYIYNLLDTERIKSLSTQAINDTRFDNSVFTIITAGRMDPVKGFLNIPIIARELKNDNIKFKWYILGGPENSEHFSMIKNSIAENEVKDYVIMLGNKINPYPYFNKADLYVSTSYSEACPMVFNEARIFSLPIVTTNFGSAPEFVSDKIDGYIKPINLMANTIKELVISKDRYHIFKNNSSNVKIINNDIITKQLKQIFQ